MAKGRRQAADWATLIDEWRQSGLSLLAFSQRHGRTRTIAKSTNNTAAAVWSAIILSTAPSIGLRGITPVRVIAIPSGLLSSNLIATGTTQGTAASQTCGLRPSPRRCGPMARWAESTTITNSSGAKSGSVPSPGPPKGIPGRRGSTLRR
jgi:hypothetical protein